MANQSGNRKASTQNVSLFNLYKTRSYNCTVNMMGNAMIQPTMYFNLRYVPMFSGPYMITSVNHIISPGSFETIVEGVRQPIASLPKISAYIQSLKTTLLTTIVDKIKEDKVPKKSDGKVKKNDIIGQRNDALDKGLDKDATVVSAQQTCSVSTNYNTYKVGTPNPTSINHKNIIQIINENTNDTKLKYIVFATMYLQSGNAQGLSSNEHNYAGIDISEFWGDGSSGFFSSSKYYYCSSKQIPYVYFDSADNHVKMLIARFEGKSSAFGETTPVDIAKFYILYFNAKSNNQNVYDSMKSTDSVRLNEIENKIQESINIYTPTSGDFTKKPNPVSTPVVSAPTPFIEKKTFTNSNSPIIESMKITTDSSQGLWEIFSARWDYNITAPCNSGSGTNVDLNAGSISGNKREYFVDTESLLQEFECDKVEFNGIYKLTLRLYANPMTSDGKLDSTRQQAVKSFSYNFKF
jgi:hypothetical protein